MRLHGIFPPLTTPFAPDGSLALDHLRSNVTKYNSTGIAGYVVVGSTGESVLLGHDEAERVWAAVREAASPDKTLIAGTGVDSTEETIRRTNRAAELGYHVALVKTPYYYKPQMTPEALTEHYLRLADAARIPILIYSVPVFTGMTVEAPVVARLAQHPNIIGIKESSGVIQRVGEIVHQAPENFQTLVGSASTFFAALAMGAVGGILAVACFVPEFCVDLYSAARTGEMLRARVLQQRLLQPTATIVSRLGVPGIKYAMDQAGYYGGPARRPFLPLSEAAKKEVEAALAGVAGKVTAGD